MSRDTANREPNMNARFQPKPASASTEAPVIKSGKFTEASISFNRSNVTPTGTDKYSSTERDTGRRPCGISDRSNATLRPVFAFELLRHDCTAKRAPSAK